MPPNGTPDATGRSSGKPTGRAAKERRPPQGEPWTWLTAELLVSPSWRALGINTRRLIDFLLVEHMNHAGRENGRLLATHKQLAAHGLRPSGIKRAIQEAVALRLIDVEFGGRWAGLNTPNRFKLTFLPDRDGATSNAWKSLTEQAVAAIKPKRKAQEFRNPTTILRGTVPPLYVVPNPNERERGS